MKGNPKIKWASLEKFFLISNLKVIFFQTYDFFGKLYDPKMAHLIFGSAIKFHIIHPIYIFGGINAGYRKKWARSFFYELPTNFHISNPNCQIFQNKILWKKIDLPSQYGLSNHPVSKVRALRVCGLPHRRKPKSYKGTFIKRYTCSTCTYVCDVYAYLR